MSAEHVKYNPQWNYCFRDRLILMVADTEGGMQAEGV